MFDSHAFAAGTHRLHDDYSRRHPYADRQGDFLPVPHGDPILRHQGYLLRADPGDLILWDSRTIHCNGPALHAPSDAPRDVPVPGPSELLRLVGYVCCTPASWCAPAAMAKRAKAALELTTSTHWPHAFVPTGYRPPWMAPRKPADYSRDEVRLILGDGGRWPGEKAAATAAVKPLSGLGIKGAAAGGGGPGSASRLKRFSSGSGNASMPSSAASSALTYPLSSSSSNQNSVAPSAGSAKGEAPSAFRGVKVARPRNEAKVPTKRQIGKVKTAPAAPEVRVGGSAGAGLSAGARSGTAP